MAWTYLIDENKNLVIGPNKISKLFQEWKNYKNYKANYTKPLILNRIISNINKYDLVIPTLTFPGIEEFYKHNTPKSQC